MKIEVRLLRIDDDLLEVGSTRGCPNVTVADVSGVGFDPKGTMIASHVSWTQIQ